MDRVSAVEVRLGSALVILAGVMFAAIAIAAYAINLAYIQYTRTELQIVTDVTTRAACRALVDTGRQSSAYLAAQRLADVNKVAGRTMVIGDGDLEFAAATRWQADNMYMYGEDPNPNSVRLRPTFFQRSREAIPMLMSGVSLVNSFRPIKEATAAQAELDIAIVLDCSSSMLAAWDVRARPEGLLAIPMPVPMDARWRIAEAGIQQMIEVFRGSPQRERVALATFNNVSLLNTPLTSDYAAIELAIAFQGQAYLGGLSSISDGLGSAVTMLSRRGEARPFASRVILLISDGNENFGLSTLASARAAAANQIMIYTISLSNEANSELMKSIASLSHGKYFHANSAQPFLEAVENVNKHLPVLITR